MLFIISYIAGNLWLLYSIIEKRFPNFFVNSDEILFDHYGEDLYLFLGYGKQARNNFYDANSFELNEDGESIIKVMYFALTTLTTIGFGDFHPISDSEKLVMVILFLGGVGVFSIMLGNFNDSI